MAVTLVARFRVCTKFKRFVYQELRREAEKCLFLDDTKGMEAVKERALTIWRKHYWKTEASWIWLVGHLRENRALATDPISYHDYLQRAEECLLRKDYEGVRAFGFRAWDLLPASEARANRFHDAGLRDR